MLNLDGELRGNRLPPLLISKAINAENFKPACMQMNTPLFGTKMLQGIRQPSFCV